MMSNAAAKTAFYNGYYFRLARYAGRFSVSKLRP